MKSHLYESVENPFVGKIMIQAEKLNCVWILFAFFWETKVYETWGNQFIRVNP